MFQSLILISALSLGPRMEKPVPSLKSLAARHGIELGANFPGLTGGKAPNNWESSPLAEQEKELAVRHFSMMSGGWESYPGSTWPSSGQVKVDGVKRLFDWMQGNKIKTHYHGLGYGVRTPWLKNLPVRTEGEKSFVRATYEGMVKETVSALKGRVDLYDLCNEQLLTQYQSRGFSSSESYWKAYATNQPFRSGWIEATFRLVRQIDPEAELIYLDFNNEVICPKSDFMFQEMKRLKSSGAPIDGVGFQMHLDTELNRRKGHGLESDEAYFQSLAANLKRFSDAGFDLWITELDVAIFPEKGLEGELKRQAEIYERTLKHLLAIKRLRGVKFWGLLDRNVWSEVIPSRPNLFDENGRPKPAFWAVARALQESEPIKREIG